MISRAEVESWLKRLLRRLLEEGDVGEAERAGRS